MKQLFMFLVGFEAKFDENLFLKWLKAILNEFELLAIAGKYGFDKLVDKPEGVYDICEYQCILEAENKLKESIDSQCVLAYGDDDMPLKLLLKDAIASQDEYDKQAKIIERYVGKLDALVDKLLSIDVDSSDQEQALNLAKNYQAILQNMAA